MKKKNIDPNDIVIAILSTLGMVALTAINVLMLMVVYSGTFLSAWFNPSVYEGVRSALISASWFSPITKSAMSIWTTFSLVFFSLIAGNILLIILYWRKFNILFPGFKMKMDSLKRAVSSSDPMYYTNNPDEDRILPKTSVRKEVYHEEDEVQSKPVKVEKKPDPISLKPKKPVGPTKIETTLTPSPNMITSKTNINLSSDVPKEMEEKYTPPQPLDEEDDI